MAFAMIVTVVGFLLLLDKMGIITGAVWEFFWPLLIIAVGLSMMFKRMDRSGCWCGAWCTDEKKGHSRQGGSHK